MAAPDLLPSPEQDLPEDQTLTPAPAPPSATPAAASAAAAAAAAIKKLPGTWTPPETSRLIDAYQEKWYELKRGQLRTCHWEEVAESLAARCTAAGIDFLAKSSVQCRHKMEKLRRKYRAERQSVLRKGPGTSQWPYYERMDIMERGQVAAKEARLAEAAAAAAAAAAPATSPLSNGHHRTGLDRDRNRAAMHPNLDFRKRMGARDMQDHESAMSPNDGEDSEEPPPLRNIRYERPLDDEQDTSYSPLSKKHPLSADYDLPRMPSKSFMRHNRPVDNSTAAAPLEELVSVVRSFGEGFLRMEQMKLQMQRDHERLRADMELRRTEMVLSSQKQIAELFTRALMSSKKSKKSSSSGS